MPDDPQDLRRLIAELTERVYRLEQLAGVKAPEPTPQHVQRDSVPTAPSAVEVPATRKPSESLESRIGSQWFNRIGIIAVLVGVSYFLKYAFENNWIGPAGRITIGLLAGIGVVAWSERFRVRGHTVFSWSLKAVGIGTLYLSLWAAFQMYHLVSGTAAFAAMVVVTAATAALAITQNAQILAAFALIGGFATPLLLSTGQNHEVVLFSYVAVLDLGTVVLLVFRPWMRLLIGSYLGTLILYVGWYLEYYSRPQLGLTLLFATLFFAAFAVAPIFSLRSPAKTRRDLSVALVFVPLLNAASYFGQVYAILRPVSRTATAWMAVLLAGVYLALSREGMRRAQDEQGSRLLKLLYVALAVGFLTAAIPLKLETHWITLAWFVEAAALMWISYRVPIQLLRALAAGTLVLGIGRLLVFDNFHPAHLLLNARFATYLVAIAAVAWSAALALRASPQEPQSAHNYRTAVGLAIILINVLALLAFNFEVRDYFVRAAEALRQLHPGRVLAWSDYRQLNIVRDFTYSAVWMIYGAGLMCAGFWQRSAFLRWQALILISVTVVKVFVYDVSELERGYRVISFIALGVLLLAVSFIYQRDWLRLSARAKGNSTAA